VSIPFYFDHHVPAAIGVALRGRGIDVLTAREDGHDRSPDEELLQRATELGRAVVSEDHDFLEIVHRWLNDERRFAGLIFCHMPGTSIGGVIDDLELVAGALDVDEIENTVVWIPL
jgi:hypothetical protein